MTTESSPPSQAFIRQATEADVSLILEMIRGLAEYEKLLHEVVATEDSLRRHLFGDKPHAEVVFLCESEETSGDPAGMALFFHNFST